MDLTIRNRLEHGSLDLSVLAFTLRRRRKVEHVDLKYDGFLLEAFGAMDE